MKNISSHKLLLCGFFAALTVAQTSAQDNGTSEPCYGSSVLQASQGLQTNGQPVAADRSDESKVLGAPSDNAAGSFYSLGVGGFIDISFDGVVFDLPGNDIEVYETSFSGNVCGRSDDEFAYIYLSQDGITWIAADTICRNAEIDIAVTGLPYVTAIRIENAAQTTTFDGYDVDAVVALNGCEDFSVLEPDECYGERALVYLPGGAGVGGLQAISADRNDPEKALGEPQRDDTFNFVSLGWGGTLIIGFDDSAITVEGEVDLELVETTFGTQSCNSYEERALVYVSQQVVEDASEIDHTKFVLVGESCTNGAFFDVSTATFLETGTAWEYFTLVKIVDTTPLAAQLSGRDGYDVDGLVALHGCAPVPPVVVIDEPCEGNWRTQSMGGWGSPGNGNNPGAYRDANFASAFPNGLVLGCIGGNTLTFTSAASVQAFLPSGGAPSVLSGSFTDPSIQTNTTSNGNSNGKGKGKNKGKSGNSGFGTFAGNITALGLSLGFDANDGNFSDSDFPLAGLVIQGGPFDGLTVGEIFAIANDVFGGCSTQYTANQLNSILDDINNAYVDGNNSNSGTLACPDAISLQKSQIAVEPSAETSLIAFPNPSAGLVNIAFNTEVDQLVTVELLDMSGRTVSSIFRQVANAGQKYRVEFDGGGLPNGVYITKMTTGSEVLIQKVMIAR